MWRLVFPTRKSQSLSPSHGTSHPTFWVWSISLAPTSRHEIQASDNPTAKRLSLVLQKKHSFTVLEFNVSAWGRIRFSRTHKTAYKTAESEQRSSASYISYRCVFGRTPCVRATRIRTQPHQLDVSHKVSHLATSTWSLHAANLAESKEIGDIPFWGIASAIFYCFNFWPRLNSSWHHGVRILTRYKVRSKCRISFKKPWVIALAYG